MQGKKFLTLKENRKAGAEVTSLLLQGNGDSPLNTHVSYHSIVNDDDDD